MNGIIKFYLQETEQILKELMENVLNIAGQYNEEEKSRKAELEKMRSSGMYSDAYLSTYLENTPYKRNYAQMIKRTCDLKSDRVKHNNKRLRELIEEYYNGELNKDLSNKFISFQQMGVKLSAKELEAMEKSATSYADKRLFNQYAENNGYSFVKLPNYDAIMRELSNYESSSLNMFNYGGINGELYEFIDKWNSNKDDAGETIKPFDRAIGKALCMGADAFIRNDETSHFKAFLDSTGIELNVKELSKDEQALIDEVLDNTSPYLIEKTVKETAENNAIMRDLFLRHDEYRKYLL